MSFKIHTSFMDSGLDAAQVEQHIGDVLDEAVSGSDRQKVLSHFYQTLAQDEEQLLKHRQVVAQAKRVLSAKSLLHRFDFSKHPGLFNVDGSDRWTRMKAKLSTNGEDVRGKAGLVISEQVYINGDNIMLDGISSGSAVDGTLTCGTTCNGTLRIQGSGVHVRGIHFKSADQNMVEFTTAASNITLEDCIFECTGGVLVWCGRRRPERRRGHRVRELHHKKLPGEEFHLVDADRLQHLVVGPHDRAGHGLDPGQQV